MTPAAPRALIAEDEPLLAAALQQELRAAWPELQIAATVGDGISAVQQALALQPDVLFFDIRMPGQTGLDAAVALPTPGPPTSRFRRWCSSPPTTNTPCRPLRPRPWTICSSPCKAPGCKRQCKYCV